MKTLFIIILTYVTLNAGEFSQIDQEVRETIIRVYDVDKKGNRLGKIDYQNDIINMNIIDNRGSDCLLKVSVYFNKPVKEKSIPSVALVCLNKNQYGHYIGRVLDL